MPEHYINSARSKIRFSLLECIAIGFGAGVVGVAFMTIAEKAEQSISHRPTSYVPGRTLARLLKFDFQSSPDNLNYTMHWAQGILTAGIRGAMSYYGVVGPFGSYLFMSVRLLIDQTLENWTGVGSLPWTWPVSEQIIDLAHKAIFAATTGYVADRLILGRSLNAW